jgi:hypothetical protein
MTLWPSHPSTNSAQVESTVQRLLGEGSVAQKKSECARALELLGWFVDLDTRTVTLFSRNLHKLLHALFCFDTLEKVSIALIQRITSLASRTSLLSRHMRPYTHALHVLTGGYSMPNVRLKLTLLAPSDILMWRSYSLLLVAHPTMLSRTLDLFQPQAPQYTFKYDASLSRIATGLYTADSDFY